MTLDQNAGYTQSSGSSSFKLDEGFSEDLRPHDESDLVAPVDRSTGFEEWVMAQNEEERAGQSMR
jgi:hypothetical protein